MTGGERTTIETAGDPLPAYQATADPGLERPPAMIVVQEYWGLVPHIEEVCRRLAAEGFTAVAPDLYRGRLAEEPDEARKLSMELDRDRAVEDLRAVVGWLLDRGNASSVGAVGFCMGGGLVWTLAHTEDRLEAAVVFYGLSEVRGLRRRAPVLAHYGTADRFPPEQIEELRTNLALEGLPGEVITYEGAPHAFFNDSRGSYRPEAARAAWERTLAFLREHLG
jgi:carboxymethylenebutenolidase